MHLFNLLLLGPLGLRYNVSVWPWNIAMICYLTTIFLSSFHQSYKPLASVQNLPVVLFWGLLPALNFLGKWDDYLSSNLYSGKTRQLLVCFKGNNNIYPKEIDRFFLKRDAQQICADGKILSVMRWSMAELNVPCYPEERVFISIKQSLLKKYPDYHLSFFVVEQTSASPAAF